MTIRRVGPKEPEPNIPTDRLTPMDLAEPVPATITKAELAISGRWHDEEAGWHFVLCLEDIAKPALTTRQQTAALRHHFGKDPASWVGHRVLLEPNEDEHGRRWLGLAPIPEPATPAPRKRSLFLEPGDVLSAVTVTITRVEIQPSWVGAKQHPFRVVFFGGIKWPLLANPLLEGNIGRLLHDVNPKEWPGRQLVLRSTGDGIAIGSVPDETVCWKPIPDVIIEDGQRLGAVYMQEEAGDPATIEGDKP